MSVEIAEFVLVANDSTHPNGLHCLPKPCYEQLDAPRRFAAVKEDQSYLIPFNPSGLTAELRIAENEMPILAQAASWWHIAQQHAELTNGSTAALDPAAVPKLIVEPPWSLVQKYLGGLSEALEPGPALNVIRRALDDGNPDVDQSASILTRLLKASACKEYRTELYQTDRRIAANRQEADTFMTATLTLGGPRSIWACELALSQVDAPLTDMIAARNKLLNNHRSRREFQSHRGLAWQLGFSAQKGYFLTIIVVTGLSVQAARNQRTAFVDYWTDRVTNGTGIGYEMNPASRTQLPPVLGIEDFRPHRALEMASGYFSYVLGSCEFLRPALPHKTQQLNWNFSGANL